MGVMYIWGKNVLVVIVVVKQFGDRKDFVYV